MGRFRDFFPSVIIKDKDLNGYLKIFSILKKKIRQKFKGLSKIHFKVEAPKIHDSNFNFKNEG